MVTPELSQVGDGRTDGHDSILDPLNDPLLRRCRSRCLQAPDLGYCLDRSASS